MSFVCLYDRTDTEDESVEDILQKAFGGRKTSRKLICGTCNNALGSTIDHEFAECLESVTSLINPLGRRKPAATLKNVVDRDGNKWHIQPGGRPVVAYQSVGPTAWIADASQFDLAKKNAEAKAKAMGIDPGSIKIEREPKRPAPIPVHLALDASLAYRSACKSALELLALIWFDEEDKRSELLLSARDFVRKGTPYSSVGWLIESVLPMSSGFGSYDHYILLTQSNDQSVYWEFVLYGGIVAIAGRFASIQKNKGSHLYRLCTRTGAVFDDKIDLQVPSHFQGWSAQFDPIVERRTTVLLQSLSVAVSTNQILDDENLDTFEKVESATEELLDVAVQTIALAKGLNPADQNLRRVLREMVRAQLSKDVGT